MSTWVMRSDAAVASPDAGGKARALASAERGSFPVPPWFVLSSSAFDGSLSVDQRTAISATADPAALGALLESVSPSPAVRSQLEAAVRDLCGTGDRLAIRSSASDEDGSQHSFAGQLESFLDVAPADVAQRVADVWRSAFSLRVFEYRRERALPPLPRPPAVLVQRMIHPRASGVAFSADPVSGRRGVAVVSAIRGLGSAIVSGAANADTWHVDRRRHVVHRITFGSPALSDDEAIAVADMARAAARHFGRPQDIEWALADRLYLLQSRPITSLASVPDPDGRLTIWDNSNIVESYSGMTTPLTFSFVREIYASVYEQFCRMMGVPGATIAAHEDTFRNMLGLVRGRLYYNLLNWYRTLALLPGYRVNRGFMEQMMGVREPLPEGLARDVAAVGTRGRVADALHVARTVGGLMVNHVSIERRIDAFYRRLDAALVPSDPPLEDQRPDELVAHYRDLRSRLLLRWNAPIVNDFFAMVFYGLLRSLVMRWLDDPGGTLQNDLIGGEGGIVSAEPAVRLQRMADLARSDDRLTTALRTGARQDAAAACDGVPELSSEIEAYLAKFGDRTINELKLESATLHDDPMPLYRAIGALAAQGRKAGDGSASASTGDRLRREAHLRTAAALRGHPLRQVVFGWALDHTRRRVRDRENLRLERTRLFGRVRRIFIELGRRLHADDRLDDPRDVFYLEIDEVLAFVDGRATCTDLRGLAGLRKQEFAGYRDEKDVPDDRFETRGTVYQGHVFRATTPVTMAGGDSRQGLGCSPGTVRSRVRVVRDPRDVDLEQRAILVAEHTDPGWIMVFPSAAGLLVERGSLLSHAAIVARELGIPAVVSIPGLTHWLRDGDLVEMDGATGLIRRVQDDVHA